MILATSLHLEMAFEPLRLYIPASVTLGAGWAPYLRSSNYKPGWGGSQFEPGQPSS